jgi:hypothetical protein
VAETRTEWRVVGTHPDGKAWSTGAWLTKVNAWTEAEGYLGEPARIESRTVTYTEWAPLPEEKQCSTD